MARPQTHSWTAWVACPAAETAVQEKERARKGLRAPPGKFEAKQCVRCGRVRVRPRKGR